MQSAATIRDAARKLDEAASVFRMKSRGALEEYGEWSAHWGDSRARSFDQRHLEPQRDLIEQGARSCQMHGSLVDSARMAADEAERELSSFFSAQAAFESAEESARQTAAEARDQAARATADSARVSAEVRSIGAGIAAASVDPGW
jgi:hypothetical protein